MRTGDRVSEARELLALYDAAAQSVIGDPAVWAEESARTDTTALPWPLLTAGPGYPQLLRIFAQASVQNILRALDAAGKVVAADPAAPEFQVILRVVKRAVDAGDRALVQRFGGTGRMSVKRELIKLAREHQAETAVRSGTPRAQAFEAAGLSRASAYRALKRSRPNR